MKASELIAKLRTLISQSGDCEVCYFDEDTEKNMATYDVIEESRRQDDSVHSEVVFVIL